MFDVVNYLTFFISFYIWLSFGQQEKDINDIPGSIFYVIFFTILVIYILWLIEKILFKENHFAKKKMKIFVALLMAATASQIVTATYIRTQKATATIRSTRIAQFITFYITFFALLKIFDNKTTK